ncbi:hypothetical protein EBZ37_14360, partial [bacterium]|nr:hypothetical protein [bacterium]
NSLPPEEFASHYLAPHDSDGVGPLPWRSILKALSPQGWLSFIEEKLGIGTFEGTSGRYFVEEMKASKLLQAWTQRLARQGVIFHFDRELLDFTPEIKAPSTAGKIRLKFLNTEDVIVDAALLALGGASYEPNEAPMRWIRIFREKNIDFFDFEPSNVGYSVAWKAAFLKEAEGKPLKSIVLHRPRETLPQSAPTLSRAGELIVTKYGLEGTPIYQLGSPGKAWLDLKPNLTEAQILERLERVRENLSPLRRAKKQLALCDAALALLFHHAPTGGGRDHDPAREGSANQKIRDLARLIKRFPLELGAPQPLTESISSRGGVALTELTPQLELKKIPRVFLAGEMLDWDTCTGGFLIQGCVSQGAWAANAIL